MEVPLFVLMSPVAGLGIVSLRFTAVQVMICAVLLSNARLPVTQNWTRPLTGPKSLLQQTRNDAYFNDVGQWNNRQSYLEAVAATAPLECSVVGLDTFRNHVQYPYMVLLRQHNPSVRFTEVGVNNASSKYADPSAARPCAVLCLDCAGHEDRIRPHTDGYSESQTFGNFVLFTAPRKRP